MQQPAPAQPPALAPGTLLSDRYFIQGYIGGGGFGHIYKAHDKVLGHRRAIKEAFYRDPNTQRQFHLEAEFLINARHPNLVQGYALFEQAGRFYLVMDYVDGYTLEDITIQQIRRTGHPLPETQILDWIIPICDAVQALHQQPTPIIHRDIKPANIKLNRKGVPVLIDLGLAKLYYRGSQTIGAALAFTPGYAPPEQYQASGATDQRTDVYGMGATLYYLLTGYQPTEAPARLSSTTLPTPRKLNPALSQATETAILRAMSLDPLARQQTMSALMAELQAARSMLVTGNRPATVADEERRIPCTRCGTANVPAARFCMRCGNPITTAQPATSGVAVAQGLQLVANSAESVVSPAPVATAGGVVGDETLLDDRHRTQAQNPQPSQHNLPPQPSQSPQQMQSLPPAASAIPAVPVVAPLPPVASPPPNHALDQARARILRSPYATFPASISRQLLRRQPTDEQEVWEVLAAILGGVAFALSLLAVISGWLLIFSLPAIGLSGWSCWSWLSKPDKTPEEFKWLAAGTLALSVLWMFAYFVFFHLLTHP